MCSFRVYTCALQPLNTEYTCENVRNTDQSLPCLYFAYVSSAHEKSWLHKEGNTGLGELLTKSLWWNKVMKKCKFIYHRFQISMSETVLLGLSLIWSWKSPVLSDRMLWVSFITSGNLEFSKYSNTICVLHCCQFFLGSPTGNLVCGNLLPDLKMFQIPHEAPLL